MRLLVMSDSHRNIEHMQYAAGQTNPDAILHLGDHMGDAQKLSQGFPNIAFHMVTGNCDLQAGRDSELLLTFESVKLLMTHGHKYGVKSGLAGLIRQARQLRVDIAVYGHTHQASLSHERGIWFLCPGQMERHDNRIAASYGIVTIEGGRVECGIEMLPML